MILAYETDRVDRRGPGPGPFSPMNDDRETPLSQPTAKTRLRVNARAAVILATLAVLIPVIYYGGMKWQDRRVRTQALEGARVFEASGNVDLAVRNLRRYLDGHPDDLATLEELARIMAISARSFNEKVDAASINDQLLRKDPDGPGRQDTRRRLAELYVACADFHRASSAYRISPETASNDLRYRAGWNVARDLIRRGAEHPEVDGPVKPTDHTLLATAWEGLAVPGDEASLAAAITEYEKAHQGDPGEGLTAERLARLYQARKNDPARGERVLDDLVAASPNSFAARLVRYRFFLRIGRSDRAAEELEVATRLAPENFDVRITAAADALRRGDVRGARRHLEAIPTKAQDDLRVRMMRGMVDYSEERPDDAIDGWRQGLMIMGGTDAELTWWLAHALLQMGRINEAKPLVAQYRRLGGADDQPLYRLLQAELDEKIGRPARAVVALDYAKERIDERWQAMVYLALGHCHEALWDRPKAMSAYRRAITIDPKRGEARLALARLLADDPNGAAAELQNGLDRVSDDPSLKIALAGARLRQQLTRPAAQRDWSDFDRAWDLAQRATPGNSSLILMRADRIAASGDLGSAIKLLADASEKAAKNPALWSALAEGQTRLGRPEEALRALDRGSSSKACGDRASLRIARAGVLLMLNRGREARDQLVHEYATLPLGDRPIVWEALGRLDAARGDLTSARIAYGEWAKLLPDDPRPRLALLELAQTSGDEATVRSTVDAIRDLAGSGGSEDVAYRLCRAQELLWAKTAAGRTKSHRDPGLEEASRLLDRILTDAPELPAAHLLRGQVFERRDQFDEAIISYRKAWDRGASAALPRLVELLTRRKRFDELAGLKNRIPEAQLDRLTAQASFRVGDYDAAGRFAEKATLDDGGSAGSKAWQAKMLELIGRPDQADATLRDLAEQKPDELEPWLALVESLANHNKSKEIRATIDRAKARVKPEDRPLAEARLIWASGDRAGADRAFADLLRAKPDDIQALLFASLFHERASRVSEAIACLRRMIEIEPKNRGAARQLSVLLAGDPSSWDQAASLVGAEDSAGEAPEDRLARAMVFAKSPDPTRKTRAIELLEALILDLPIGGVLVNKARAMLASLLLATGRPDRAAAVSLIIAQAGADTEALSIYIESLLRAGNLDEADRQISRLASLTPDGPAEASFRARWTRLTSEPSQAPGALERAVKDRKGGAGDVAFARAAFAELLAIGPAGFDAAERVARLVADSRPTATWMLAQVAARRGRFAESPALALPAASSDDAEDRRWAARVALEAFDKSGADPSIADAVLTVMDTATRRGTNDYDLLLLSGMARHLAGRFADEVAQFRSALELKPGDAMASNNLAWALSESLDRAPEAIAVLDESIRRNGRLPWILDTRGVILTRLGRFDEAIVDLKASAADRPSPTILYHLARAYRKAGRDADFRASRDQARRIGLSPKDLDPAERDEMRTLMAL